MTLIRSRPARWALLLVATAVFAAWTLQAGSVEARRVARATLANADGEEIGQVRFVERRDGVEVRAEVSGISPGFHGFHVHENGTCEPDFAAAGGHWNPDGTDHGAHAGDMTSLYATADGSAALAFTTDAFTVDELLAADVAVMVHGGRDNFANIPERYLSTTEDVNGPDSETLGAGDAGPRVACGVVER